MKQNLKRYKVTSLVSQSLTLSGLLLVAAVEVAAEAGVQRTAEALVVEHSEGVEADARLVVKLAAVLDVAATQSPTRLLTLET